MTCNPWLAPLANIRHVIVRFGLDGAIYYNSGHDGGSGVLIFDPNNVEGGFAESHSGGMQGAGNAFIAAFTKELAEGAADGTGLNRTTIVGGIDAGLQSARMLHRLGYGRPDQIAAFPSVAIFARKADRLAQVAIPTATELAASDPDFWSILHDMNGAALQDLAEDLVRKRTAAALRDVPMGRFGRLRTVDRTEIEGFRALRNLLKEYLSSRGGARCRWRFSELLARVSHSQ